MSVRVNTLGRAMVRSVGVARPEMREKNRKMGKGLRVRRGASGGEGRGDIGRLLVI